MSSFSCLKEYFLPELSSFGRFTGQTEITGRADTVRCRSLTMYHRGAYLYILPKVRISLDHCERQLRIVSFEVSFVARIPSCEPTNFFRIYSCLRRNWIIR